MAWNDDFCVGDWIVLPELNQIQRGAEVRRLEPKIMEVLGQLARCPGKVQSKQQILDSVWSEAFVSEEVLTNAISELRKALGDDARDPAYIETIPKRGYRLIAKVTSDGHLTQSLSAVQEHLDTGKEEAEADERHLSPYPGLAPFTCERAHFFFGREIEIESIWTKVRGTSLVALIGSTGAGKTSFVQAGMIPAAPEGWSVVVSTPGAHPFVRLAQALADHFSDDAEVVKRLIRFEDPEIAVATVSQWRRRHGEGLIVIDQFEELFTQNTAEVQERFAEFLGHLVRQSKVRLLLSMRDDFLMACHRLDSLKGIFEGGLFPLGPPPSDSLRRALVEPAESCGFRFEDEVMVDRMLEEVLGEQSSLPLLAFAAARLWEQRDRRRKVLTREVYEAIGGVAGALARHADSTLEEIGQDRVQLVRELFRNLMTAQGTRAAQGREELLSVFRGSRRKEAEGVLDRLIDSRLLVSSRDSAGGRQDLFRIELAHESLLTSWLRLVRWRTQDREGAQLRDELRQLAAIWEHHARSSDFLWYGTAFREFELWRERYPGSLTPREEDFARAMVSRSQRRKRLVIGGLSVLFLVVLAVIGMIGISRQRALDAARQAEASKLLALAQVKLQDDPSEALAFATASLGLDDSEEARLFVLRAIGEGPPVSELQVEDIQVRIPVFSPDGTRLCGAGNDSSVKVWNENGSVIATLQGWASVQGSTDVRWAADDLLIAGLWSGAADQVSLWKLPEGRLLRSIDFGQRSRWWVHPGRLLVDTIHSDSTGKGSRELRSWQLPDGDEEVLGRFEQDLQNRFSGFSGDGSDWLRAQGKSVFSSDLPIDQSPEREFSRHAEEVSAIGFLWPNSAWIRDESGRIRVWSWHDSSPREIRDIPRPETAPSEIRPETSGRWVWSKRRADSSVQIWHMEALPGARPLTLRRSGSWFAPECDLHPSGDWLVSPTRGRTRLTFWPLPKNAVSVVDGYRVEARPVAFSPDSRWLATGWGDGVLRLWPLPGNHSEVRKLDGPRTVWRKLLFDPTGRYLFAATSPGAAYLFPLDGTPALRLEGFSDVHIDGCAFSTSGRLLAAASGFGSGVKTLRIWELETGQARVYPLPVAIASEAAERVRARVGYEGSVKDLYFDGETVLYSSGDGGIRRWDLSSGNQELIWAATDSYVRMSMSEDRRTAYVVRWNYEGETSPSIVERVDLATGQSEPVKEFGETWWGLHVQGSLLAAAGEDGFIRFGEISGGAPHLLAGHVGAATHVAISPDRKWIASTGEDNTLRLRPRPDLSRLPLHLLPHDQLVAKLKSLTNLRALPDPAAPTGWKIELAAFPGWQNVPTR